MDLEDLKTVEEFVNNFWYDYSSDPKGGGKKQPWSWETNINYTFSKTSVMNILDVDQKIATLKRHVGKVKQWK